MGQLQASYSSRAYRQSMVDAPDAHTRFMTFSCVKRRHFLDADHTKRIFLGVLARALKAHDVLCHGYVLMPDHVHLILRFQNPISCEPWMARLKSETSRNIKQTHRTQKWSYAAAIPDSKPVWKDRFYVFNIFTIKKLEEKLIYLHENPVRAGLVERAIDYKWSSARRYRLGESAPIPIMTPHEWIQISHRTITEKS